MTTSLSVRWTVMTEFHVSVARRFAKDFSTDHALISSVYSKASWVQFRRLGDVWCMAFSFLLL